MNNKASLLASYTGNKYLFHDVAVAYMIIRSYTITNKTKAFTAFEQNL